MVFTGFTFIACIKSTLRMTLAGDRDIHEHKDRECSWVILLLTHYNAMQIKTTEIFHSVHLDISYLLFIFVDKQNYMYFQTSVPLEGKECRPSKIKSFSHSWKSTASNQYQLWNDNSLFIQQNNELFVWIRFTVKWFIFFILLQLNDASNELCLTYDGLLTAGLFLSCRFVMEV